MLRDDEVDFCLLNLTSQRTYFQWFISILRLEESDIETFFRMLFSNEKLIIKSVVVWYANAKTRAVHVPFVWRNPTRLELPWKMSHQVPALRPRKIEPDASIKIQWLQDDGERASSHSHANKRNPISSNSKELSVSW